ncbi:hypothetical protein [Actinomycetospora sp. TBRC 11914]|uniref:hypothetical protein n=1 Tax=Actinomycetospora sp. TBRC 11914 TaxID=2729387 RepID=UPI00145E9FA7|nr:hypothetical protein [Actinomycetospora sp. TBRC 11914]NMO90319.1 hypothetical protein [Actinomycetospora sp. TBRC 11914]
MFRVATGGIERQAGELAESVRSQADQIAAQEQAEAARLAALEPAPDIALARPRSGERAGARRWRRPASGTR